MPSDPAVLIVGAGPTGLTAAVELARRGIKARIIDRNDGPTPLSKAVGINPRSLDLLEPGGVTARLLAAGIRIQEGHIHVVDRELATLQLSRLPHRFNFLLSLPQSETETLLAEVLSEHGVTVERQTELTALRPEGDGLVVTLQGPAGREDTACETLFGADGVHSTVRDALGLAFDGYTHERTWSIADAEIDAWPYAPASANLFLHPGGDVGFIIPVGEHRFRAVSNTPDALARIPGNYRILRRLRSDSFKIPVRQVATYQKGRVFLGGDAAHVHSPVGGRGMNLGIEDAATFARLVAEGGLEGYTAARHAVGARWIAASERVLAAVQARSPAAVGLRNAALWCLGRLPALQGLLLARAAGLRD